MKDEAHGKLSEQINFGVTPETLAAAEKVEADTGIRVTHMARAGFIKELQLYRHGLGNQTALSPAELKALAEYRKVTNGAEITDLIQRALRRGLPVIRSSRS